MTDRTKLTSFCPIFPVADLRASLEHYETLGFRVAPYANGDDYGFAERDGVDLHLTYRPTSYYPDGGISVAYLVVDDASNLFAEWTRPGIGGTTDAPADMPWGMHEGIHADPDGNIIRFGSQIPLPSAP
jgi:catechol 2,3-dioxygenase-like lactoylglutathione lyase family enzyme